MSYKNSKSAAVNLMTTSLSDELTAADENENYTLCTDGRYEIYQDYYDDNYSTVDTGKSVTVDKLQRNITQETNSQYMPFKIPRYWDGIDLVDMLIQIRYENTSQKGQIANVINVAYNDSYITFGWLIDSNVTAQAGEITFEIMATGINEKGNSYVWRTQPNGKFTVLEGLNYDGIIEPSDEWYTSFVNMILTHVNDAKQYADSAKASAESIDADLIAANVKNQVSSELNQSITESLKGYYTKTEINAIVDDINTSIEGIDSLANLKVQYDSVTGDLVFKDGETQLTKVTINSLSNLTVKYEVVNGKGTLTFYNGETEITSVVLSEINPSAQWTDAFEEKIQGNINTAVGPVSEKANTLESNVSAMQTEVTKNTTDVTMLKADVSGLKTSSETYSKDISDIKNSLEVMEQNISGHDADILGLNTSVAEIDEKLKNFNTTVGKDYDVDYKEDGTFIFYENEDIKKQFTIKGGGGGTVETSVITIERITDLSAIFLAGEKAVIEYNYSSVDNVGDPTGNGTATWKVGNTVVATSTAIQGKNSFDITQYLKTGANSIRLSITDSFGTIGTKTWTVTVVEFKIESIFDDTLFYSGEVTFRYTPYGDINKNIHFVLDGKEIAGITTLVTGRQMTQTIPAQSHGSHLLKVYMTAAINGQEVTSEPVYKDIVWIDASNDLPVIGCNITTFTIKQYNTIIIPYIVYDPNNNPANVTLSVDGKVVSTLTVGRTPQVWSYKSSAIGTQTLTITCGEIVKTITAAIEKLDIDITPVTTNLAFDFNPSGKNNGETDWLKINEDLTINVSDNFDTTNGGYQIDEDGDTYFCVKAGTTATIPYDLFGDDAKKTGKNFKFVYKSTNVRNYDAQVLSCYSNAIGFRTYAQEAILNSEQNSINVPYCEDNYMELEFNILPDAQYTEMVMWLDGVPARVKLYSASDSFTQTAPVGITIGSPDCDVWVYRMKSYTMNLTDDEILDNFIADAKNADDIINRYTRNNILDSSGGLDPDLLAETCPGLRVIKLEVPRFTKNKKDKTAFTSIQQIYKNGRDVDNWITLNGIHSGQGTSSDNYGEAGRNLDFNCKNGFDFSDGTHAEGYSMTENSVPVNYFNVKVNIASSENINNSGLAEEYNTFNPYIREARKNNPKVRDTMEFHPCVVFVKETDIENSVEFHDGEWHFYATGNIGNSKKNSEAMGMIPENHKEFIVEVSNNINPQCRFLSDDLSAETWDGDGSFEMRYENPDCTPEELQAGKDAWQDVLSWVVNSTPETFVAEFEEHFVKDSVLFFYLFTERHTMVDNRAKNTFWHTEDLIHWDICFDYDNDTAMGNDNEGGLTLRYGYEDTDTIGSKSVFNASDSKLWCYVRDYMYDDLATLFIQLESRLAWSSNRILSAFEAEQQMKPERLWITDMRRKYFRPYEDNGTTAYLEMMHGDKKHQRRQFQRYQEKYIASKYVGTACTSDVITVRGYTPTNWSGVAPDGTFHIVPYADTYVVAKFGSDIQRVRGKRGTTYKVRTTATMNDTEVYVYNASIIQSIGDIAPFYAGYVDFNQGIKLTDLLIGSAVEGYSNTNMSDFGIGQNILLEKLNLQNLPNLKKTISLAECKNLEEFMAEGSGITGVIFAPGGKIRVAHLPAIASLTAKNLYMLEELTLEGYDNLTTLSLDNCTTIDELDLLSKCKNLTRIRLAGINWDMPDTDTLDRLSTMAGIDDSGYNTLNSVITGRVHVPIMRQQKLDYYSSIWPDLKITYDTMIVQYKVTFINDDENETILDIQYVDKGGSAVDPITRKDNPIPVPAKQSTVQNNFTFNGWDESFTGIFSDKTIRAVYTATVREYTVKYVSKGTVLQESKAPYGTNVYYEGDMPVYTLEESAYKYNLFRGWDKSGLVDGDKTINAVFDTCEYTVGCFDGKDLSELSQVELYAIMKLGLESELLSIKDSLDFEFGNDYAYDDVEQKEIIAAPKVFDGTNHYDSNVSLMDIDRDFTLAIDYEFADGNTTNSTLAQCYQYDGSNGFRLWYSNEPRLNWGTDSIRPSNVRNREIVVMRHIAGSETITLYNSNLSGEHITSTKLTSIRVPVIPATLVFGAAKADDGVYENYAKGTVHWCKIWYADLGDTACRDIAQWPHQTLKMELAKFRSYYLADTASKRAPLTFLAANLLDVTKAYSGKSTNEGGWAVSTLNTWLNTRLYNALSPLWKALIKPVKVYSSVGNKSTETSMSSCYFYVPSLYEIDNNSSSDPYINETNAPVPYMLSPETRRRAKSSTPNVYATYLTRSPNVNFVNYVWNVDENGNPSGYSLPSYADGILLMFSLGV